MPYARAALVVKEKGRQGELLMEMVVWRLPQPTVERRDAIKYRFYLGRAGHTVVRYDNETSKGPHRHVGPDEIEEPYEFDSIETAIAQFRADCEQHGWRWTDEKAAG